MKKNRVSKRMTTLCTELKAQLEDLDKPSEKPKGPTAAQKRQILFEELKEKLKTVSN